MPDDSEPPKQNEFEPNGPSNRPPRKTLIGSGDNDDELFRLLKRAIRKIERETGKVPTLSELAALMKLSVPVLRGLIEKYLPKYTSEGSSAFKSSLCQILMGLGPLQPGHSVMCKVLKVEPGGYEVMISHLALRGFLPTEASLKVGEEVLAQYVCVHNNRVLFSARLEGKRSTNSPNERMLEERIGQSVPHYSGRMRRSTDLIVPPIDKNQQPNRMRISQVDDLLWLVADLEGGMRTGCVKATCMPKKSRSALLVYRGRAVGCVYGCKDLNEPPNTETALQMMLSDCVVPGTQLVMYALPGELVLAMSALFLGSPVERSDDLDARSYMDYMLSWLSQNEHTACLSFSLPNGDTLLSFVYKGRFVGSFHVDAVEFSSDIQFVYDQICRDPNTKLQASILPHEMDRGNSRPGFGLSSNMPNA